MSAMDAEPAPLAIDVAFHGDPARMADAARDADRASAVRGLFVSEARHDPFITLGLASVNCERVQIGTSIAIAFARSPMSTAISAYDIHRLSGGRLILGLGSQIKPHITRRYDMPWSKPADRMREYVGAVRAIWNSWQTDQKLDFRGEFYTHTLMPPLFNPGPLGFASPEIWLAGVGPRMVGVAGAVADGFMCHPLLSKSYLADVLVPILEENRASAPAADSPFTIQAMAMVATGRTEEDFAHAIAGTRRQIGFYASTPAYRPVLDHHGWGELHEDAYRLTKEGRWDDLAALVDDEVLNTFAVVGDLETAGHGLRERFDGLAERVSLSIPYEVDDQLPLDLAALVH
jgi:probable F420-dependent oxidoreductase